MEAKSKLELVLKALNVHTTYEECRSTMVYEKIEAMDVNCGDSERLVVFGGSIHAKLHTISAKNQPYIKYVV